jgi:hypothetical protein
MDINDENLSIFTSGPIPNSAITSGSYSVGVDGRGQAKLATPTPFGSITLDFVLQDSSHGLVTEFDGDASGSGTLDLQTAGVTPTGSYAFSFSGADYSIGDPYATIGNFTLGSGGSITAGLEDSNDGEFPYVDLPLSGTVVLGPSSTPSTFLSTSTFGTLTFDVYAIDASHLKFIEMDEAFAASGDAYSQNSTTVPTGSMPFTVQGFYIGAPTAAGGFMTTDGGGNILSTSTEDINENLSVSQLPLSFSAQYTAAGTGRYTLQGFSGFVGGTSYVAYPYSVGSGTGMFLLETDGTGILIGAAYPPQTAGATFNAGQGYGLNLTGINSLALGTGEEVDDIAEFTATASGTTVTGYDDENFDPGGGPSASLAFSSGLYTPPDVNGRGLISAFASNLNGGYLLTFYTVDGTTFPFIESDSGQVSAGLFVEQNATLSSSAAAAKTHMFVPPHLRAKLAKRNTAGQPRKPK